jgi:sporulation protein YlmC with PRC-barrel domain
VKTFNKGADMKRKFIASTTAFALGATLAFAQADQKSPGSSQSSQGSPGAQSKQVQGTEASQQELKVSSEQLQQRVTDINKASKLIGMQVRNTKNENLGKISDLVLDPKSGKVAYAALSVGGVLGVGDKLVAVPFEAFTPNPGQDGLVLNIDKQRLQQATGFSQNNWPDLDAASKGNTVGISSSNQTESTGASGAQSQQQPGQGDSAKPQPAQPSPQDQTGSDAEKKGAASGTDKAATSAK